MLTSWGRDQFLPTICDPILQDNEVVAQAWYHSLTLTCSVEAFPPAQVNWKHDGVQVGYN